LTTTKGNTKTQKIIPLFEIGIDYVFLCTTIYTTTQKLQRGLNPCTLTRCTRATACPKARPWGKKKKKKEHKKVNLEKVMEAKRRHNFPLILWNINIKHERAGIL
jgi:hypothetical protein